MLIFRNLNLQYHKKIMIYKKNIKIKLMKIILTQQKKDNKGVYQMNNLLHFVYNVAKEIINPNN